MKRCPKCGACRNPEDAICPECGVIYEVYNYFLHLKDDASDEEMTCPACGAPVMETLTSCPNCDALLCFDAQFSPQEDRVKKLRTYSYGQALLREREYVFEKIHSEHELDRQVRYFSFYSLLFSAIYGFSLGMFAGDSQILAALIKVPVLLFGTLSICLPVLHILNVLFGIKLTFKQILTMLLASTYLMSATLGSLSPILFFFILLTKAKKFISILNIIMFAISGLFGLRLIWNGMRYLNVRSSYTPKIHIVKIWYVIYVLIGTQLAWILRPFIGEKGSFALFREIEGNFYLALYKIILDIFR